MERERGSWQEEVTMSSWDTPSFCIKNITPVNLITVGLHMHNVDPCTSVSVSLSVRACVCVRVCVGEGGARVRAQNNAIYLEKHCHTLYTNCSAVMHLFLQKMPVTRLQFDATRVHIAQEMFSGAILINKCTVTHCHVTI